MTKVQTSIDATIATITLDGPARLNALTWEVMDDVRNAVEELGGRDDVAALVITGAGRAFSAGYDLIDLQTNGDDIPASIEHGMTASLSPMCGAIAASRVPVVAAVNGPCAGGGLGLALLADVTIAAKSAYFLVSQVHSLGIAPDAGATWLLARHVGRARALGMSLTGERIDAARAERWGLIWRCVDDADLLTEAAKLATRISRRGAATVATRTLVDAATASTLTEQLDAEARAQSVLIRTQPRPGPSIDSRHDGRDKG